MSFRTKALGVVCAACIAVSGYVFSQRSINNLKETHPDLQKLAHCALEKTPTDFVIVDGWRSDAEHQKNLANGVSWIKRSRHQDGMAIDVAAYVDGKITYEVDYYVGIAGAFYFCSDLHDIPIIHGGEWRVKDYMHIELDRRRYP
jgi:peptidoglycan L-alanyl-D-glutamate endopeptidase CwlK